MKPGAKSAAEVVAAMEAERPHAHDGMALEDSYRVLVKIFGDVQMAHQAISRSGLRIRFGGLQVFPQSKAGFVPISRDCAGKSGDATGVGSCAETPQGGENDRGASGIASGSRPVLYVAGPMTGIPEFNYPAFEDARRQLEAAGFTVLCPTDNDPDPATSASRPWEWYLRRALRQVVDAGGVAVLPDAICSKGACLEIHVARALGMEVRPVAAWLEASHA